MGKWPRGPRRVAVVVLTTLSAAAVTVLSTGAARAGQCDKPSELGNATVAAGVLTVGVDQNNIGTTEHDVIACVDPAGSWVEWWVDVTDRNPGAVGVQATSSSCIQSVGCWTYVAPTGAEVAPPGVGVPSTSVNPPADGDRTLGVDTGTGTTACAWAHGAQACGGTVTTAGGDPRPDPVPLAEYMAWRVLTTPGFVDACLWLMNGQWIHGGVGCALIFAYQYAINPALTVLGWL